MLNEETIKNYKAVEKLVKEKFNLTEDSMSLFSKLLFNPDDAIEFEKIASQPDRRLFVDIDPLNYEQEDPIWRKFKSYFPIFINEQEIEYKNYLSGKKGDKKIITAMVEFIVTDPRGFVELIGFLKTDRTVFEKTIETYFKKNYKTILSGRETSFYFDDERICVKIGKKIFKKKFNSKEVAIVIKEIKQEFSNIMNTTFFGIRKASTACVCFSLNFADWILASTGENWSSCISLKSDNGYWRGLAGLVGDKNRLLIFVTDKTEKEFKGIKSFKMIERCWAFLYKDFLNKKVISSNRLYPKKIMPFNLKPFINMFGSDIAYIKQFDSGEGPCYTSLYTFPTIFHKPLEDDQCFISSSIYEDTHEKIVCEFDITKSYYSTVNNENGTFNTIFYKNGSYDTCCEYLDGSI